MAVGSGIPHEPKEPGAWPREPAHGNGPSALVVARSAQAPEIHPQMLAVADECTFPVIAASFELDFVKLSRQVIELLLQAQRDRFDAARRLFQTYATALRDDPDMAARLDALGYRMGIHRRSWISRAASRSCKSGAPCPRGAARKVRASGTGEGGTDDPPS